MSAYIVVDASVAGAWSFTEPYTAQAQSVLVAIEQHRVTALVPDRFAEEVMRICQKKTLPPPAGASIAPDDAWDRFIDVVTSPIVLLPSEELHAPAWQLATTLGLTTHDALYLALADMWGTELWTLDAGLASQHHHFKVKDLRNEPFTY